MSSNLREASGLPIGQQLAVIDIGASSIRLQISQIKPDGSLEKLEALSQGISIGRDSFTQGLVSKGTIEECVRVLSTYRQKLSELGLHDSRYLRVVATSGLREASNRLAFQDRIFIATGLEIETFDEAELHRITYLGVQPYFATHPEVFAERTLVCEVGGGTTESLLFKNSDVLLARSFRLGSLRLRKMLDAYDAPAAKHFRLLESQTNQYVKQMYHACGELPANYVAMGGDIRFMLGQVGINFVDRQLAEVSVKELRDFTDTVVRWDPDTVAQKFRLPQAEAESLGPALLAHLLIAEKFQAPVIYVANVNLRDGLMLEMAQGAAWSESVQSQIIRSAIQLGQRYDFDCLHATNVAYSACRLFEQLAKIHRVDDRHKIILHLAAVLHEIGLYINSKSFHKHSMYLIQNSDFFGLNANELFLVSLVARYHRRATPLPSHEGYSSLNRENRVLVAKLAAILRMAVALNSTRQQRHVDVECQVTARQVNLAVENVNDYAIESNDLITGAKMFEDLFGLRVSLVNRALE